MNFLKINRNFTNKFRLFTTTSRLTSTFSGKEITTTKYKNDDLTQSIRSVTDTWQLFETISGKQHDMTSENVLQSLRTLFVLQKSGNTTLHTSQILKHPDFEGLCRSLKIHARSVEINDLIESLKILSFLGISSNSEISYILLKLIKHQINDVELGHIVFLSFLLKKFDASPLVDALKMSLPMLFQIQVPIKMDHENIPQLAELLQFVSRNRISDKIGMNIITALTMHGENLSPDEARSIIWSICDSKKFLPAHEKLLRNSLTVFKNNLTHYTFDHLDSTLSKLIEKFMQKNSAFYDDEFFSKCVEYVIGRDVGFIKGIYVLKKFNKIAFIDLRLLDYIASKVVQKPTDLSEAKPSQLFTFVSAFSTANYTTTDNWDLIKNTIKENSLLRSEKNELPWMKFSLELFSIGCYDKNLIEKLFSDEFLDRHLSRDYNLLDYLQFLVLYQSVALLHPEYDGNLPNKKHLDQAIEFNFEKNEFPLSKLLSFAFGENLFYTKMRTKFGHFLDHVIAFDDDMNPVRKGDEIFIEDLQKKYSKVVAILFMPSSHYCVNVQRMKGIFDIKIQTMEAMNINVFKISYSQFNGIPDQEKIPYLQQEIRNRVK